MLSETWKKSTRSNPSGNCVEARWKKSTRSGAAGHCVEVKSDDSTEFKILVRDTKLGDGSPVLAFNQGDWNLFLDEIKQGITCPMGGKIETWLDAPGMTMLDRTDTTTRLAFTQAEWDAFVGGVRDGEFDLATV